MRTPDERDLVPINAARHRRVHTPNPLLDILQIIYALTIKMNFIAVIASQAFDLLESAAFRPVPTVEEWRNDSNARITGHGLGRPSLA